MTPTSTARPAPVPAAASELLARSDAELVAATLAGNPDEQFVHAHVAALRAGAALLQVTGRPTRRPAMRSVWEMVAAVAPGLSRWAAFFADNASARSAIEAGRPDVVDADRAELAIIAAEDFQASVREHIGAAPADASLMARAG